MVTATIGPIMIALSLFVAYCASVAISIQRGRNDDEVARKRVQLYSYLFLLLAFCVLVGSSSSAVHFLKCTSFETPEGSFERYLSKDFSIDCDSSHYKIMRVYAIISKLTILITDHYECTNALSF